MLDRCCVCKVIHPLQPKREAIEEERPNYALLFNDFAASLIKQSVISIPKADIEIAVHTNQQIAVVNKVAVIKGPIVSCFCATGCNITDTNKRETLCQTKVF